MIRLFQRIASMRVVSTLRGRPETTDAVRRQSLAQKILNNWPDNEPIRVERALELYPELQNSDRAFIELAIDEFHDRRGSGEEISESQFAEDFPDEVRSALLDSLLFDNMFESAIGDELSGYFRELLTRSGKGTKENWPNTGEEFAGFRLVEPLGEGGFSRVFVAEDLEYENRRVAVKVCRSDTHEARTLADLQHSGIGVVHYVREVESRGLVAICMPLSSRSTLHDVRRRAWSTRVAPTTAAPVWDEVYNRNKLTREAPRWSKGRYVDWILDMMIELCRSLAVSHENDIVHCDLKPSNVLVTDQGKPILVDFNVAFRRDATSSPGNVGGTLPYMAPEQIRAFRGRTFSSIDERTDIFGLGATFYELLTGNLPFGAAPSSDDGLSALLQQRRTPPKNARSINSDVPIELDQIINSCLAYSPHMRPQSADQLAERLDRLRTRRGRNGSQVTKVGAWIVTAVATILLAVGMTVPEPSDREEAAGLLSGATDDEIIDHRTPDEEEAAGIVKQALASFAAGNYAVAERQFSIALSKDSQHEGARLGLVRTLLALDKPGPALDELKSLDRENIPELAGLHAYCIARSGPKPVAAGLFEKTVLKGFGTPAVRTNWALCLHFSGKPDEAISQLEELYRQDAATDQAMLLLATLYPEYWQRHRKTPRGPVFDLMNVELIEELLDKCESTWKKHYHASLIYTSFGRMNQKTPPAHTRWSLRALDAFNQACDLGLDPNRWNCIHQSLHEDVLDHPVAARLSAELDTAAGFERYEFLLVDPLSGTTLEHSADRRLVSAIAVDNRVIVARNE